jgi:hypothetical protein
MDVAQFAQSSTLVPVPGPQPDPVAVMTRLVQDSSFTSAFTTFMNNVLDGVATNFTDGMFGLLNTAWGLPGALFNRSSLESDPRITQMNGGLIVLLAGMIGAACVVAAVSNVVAIRKGQTPSFGGALMNVTTVIVAATFAVGSIDWLSFPLDFADTIFETIGSVTLQDFAQPGLVIVPTAQPIGGIILALLFFAVMAWLTYVAYKELAWCGTLLANSVLWVFAWILPWSVPRTIGGGLGMKFIGTCFSPAIMLTALRLAAPTLNDLGGQGDPALMQMFRILYAMVAYEAPGVLAGAIAVHMPAFGDAYLANRAVGFLRTGPSPSGRPPGGPAAGGAADAASAPRAQGWSADGPASGHWTAPVGSSMRRVRYA